MNREQREQARGQQYRMLLQLHRVAEQLPAGVLVRLLADAEFYRDWCRGKRRSRGAGRMAQIESARKRIEEAQWQQRTSGHDFEVG